MATLRKVIGMSRLKCKNCNYETVEINNPYGIPEVMIPKIIRMHKLAYPTHEVEIKD